MDSRGWVVSRRTVSRASWGAAGVLLFGAAAGWALVGAVAEPSVPSIVLALIAGVLAVFALALAGESIGSGVVHLDGEGYAAPLAGRRSWRDVLDVGTGMVDGRVVPVVAVLTPAQEFVVTQDVFPGFADQEADELVRRMTGFVPATPGFVDVSLPEAWWTAAEAEADRAEAAARAASGRRPSERRRIEFGFPGLVSAILLDYGTNASGEGVQLICRLHTDLALVVDGRRYLRQNRRRSGDAAAQVASLFADHTTQLRPGDGGFDLAVVTPAGGRPLRFNAEEPDRF